MNENLTEIVCVLDRSGSMNSTKEDAIGGFNAFLTGQKEMEGEAQITVVLFDDAYETLYTAAPIEEAAPLDDTTFVPRGMTALYDAVGRTIKDVGQRLAKLDEANRPGKVIFVILTDGLENSSKEYQHAQIYEMIQHQTDTYKWEFMFLGANIDAKSVASGLGVSAANAVTYSADSVGTMRAYDSLNSAVGSYRTSGVVDPSWSKVIIDNDADEGNTDGSDTSSST